MTKVNYILKDKKGNDTLFIAISSIMASIFSIVFSLAIIKEIFSSIDEMFVFGFLCLFVVSFVLFNEYKKVRELRSLFSGGNYSLFIIVFTFIVSIALSSIGIYFWTNKSMKESFDNDSYLSNKTFEITEKYNLKIDSIYNVNYTKNPNFIQLKSNLDYWKGRSSASLEERSMLRTKVDLAQEKINKFIEQFKLDQDKSAERLKESQNRELNLINTNYNGKNKFTSRKAWVSLIFISMVLIVEMLIIFLTKEWSDNERNLKTVLNNPLAKQLKEDIAIITDLLLRKGVIDINGIKYSPFKEDKRFNEGIKSTFGRYVEIGIANGSGDMIIDIDSAVRKIKWYYNHILNFEIPKEYIKDKS
jgi:hypothetical protein